AHGQVQPAFEPPTDMLRESNAPCGPLEEEGGRTSCNPACTSRRREQTRQRQSRGRHPYLHRFDVSPPEDQTYWQWIRTSAHEADPRLGKEGCLVQQRGHSPSILLLGSRTPRRWGSEFADRATKAAASMTDRHVFPHHRYHFLANISRITSEAA